ncbi:MAG: hypothetical protein ACREPN_03395 [Rudaea sp.]
MNLLAELKRRKVFKVGAAYVVVAWLVIQAVSIAFPAFDTPPWVLRVFILVSLLGFPVTLVMAWMFDATPQGVKFDPDVRGSKRIYAIAVLLAVLALGWYFYGQPTFRKGDVATPTTSDPNTIAVLPFDNMSGDPKQDYFSDGMTEQLLDVLAKVPQLKVVARTSVFAFKGKGEDVREIGRKLGVANIVEGSVRRDGDEVRVTAQLVRVSDGFHVWSDTYDRKLEGVFALQDDIAHHVGEALKQSLGVVAPIAARTPVDPGAYDEYLKGRALLRSRSGLSGAIEHFKAAVAKAPEFGAGWSSLSLAYDVSSWWIAMNEDEKRAALVHAADAAERAATADPGAAATEHALANVARAQFRYADAEGHYLRSMQIDPGYPDVREDYAEMLNEVGREADALHAARRLVTLDPFFSIGWVQLLFAAISLDARAEVMRAASQLQSNAPNNPNGTYAAIDYALAYGRIDEARAALADVARRWPEKSAFAQELLPWALHEKEIDTISLRDTLVAAPQLQAVVYLVARQDIAAYNDLFEHGGAITQSYYFVYLHRSKPSGWAMLRGPRVKAKLIEYGFVAYWREKGWPTGCRALGDTDFECGLDATKASTP